MKSFHPSYAKSFHRKLSKASNGTSFEKVSKACAAKRALRLLWFVKVQGIACEGKSKPHEG